MALGLLAKPMLVSLPLLLLVLDFWPLARRGRCGSCVEKLPFAALALGSSLVTLLRADGGDRRSSRSRRRAPRERAASRSGRRSRRAFAPVGSRGAVSASAARWPLGEVALAAGAVVAAVGGARVRAAPARAVPRGRLALVRVRARADARPGPGRLPVDRRPLRVPATDRCRLRAGLGAAICWRARWRRARSARRSSPSLRSRSRSSRARSSSYWRDDLALWQRVVAVTGPNFFAADGARHRAHRARAQRRGVAALRRARLELAPGLAARAGELRLRALRVGRRARRRRHSSARSSSSRSTASEVHLYYARAPRRRRPSGRAVRRSSRSPDDRGALMGWPSCARPPSAAARRPRRCAGDALHARPAPTRTRSTSCAGDRRVRAGSRRVARGMIGAARQPRAARATPAVFQAGRRSRAGALAARLGARAGCRAIREHRAVDRARRRARGQDAHRRRPPPRRARRAARRAAAG